MKNSLLPAIAFICAVGIGFFAGRFSADLPFAAIGETSLDPAGRPRADRSAPGIPQTVPDEPSSVALNAEEARARAFQILSLPNRLERLREFSAFLPEITASNWKTVIDAFLLQTEREGRLHGVEWNAVLERIGEVAGGDAIPEMLASADPREQQRAQGFITGWAGADPKAAAAWWKAQPPDQQAPLRRSFFTGLGRSDPQLALSLLVGQRHEIWEEISPAVLDGAIQLGGFRLAEDLHRGIKDNPGGGAAAGKFFYDLAARQVAAHARGDNPAGVLDWFDQYFPSGPGTNGFVLRSAAQAAPERTLAWLDARADRIPPAQAATVYQVAASAFAEASFDAFVEWAGKSQNHPQFDAIAAVAVTANARRRQLSEARAFHDQIQDPKAREAAGQMIQRLSQPAAP